MDILDAYSDKRLGKPMLGQAGLAGQRCESDVDQHAHRLALQVGYQLIGRPALVPQADQCEGRHASDGLMIRLRRLEWATMLACVGDASARRGHQRDVQAEPKRGLVDHIRRRRLPRIARWHGELLPKAGSDARARYDGRPNAHVEAGSDHRVAQGKATTRRGGSADSGWGRRLSGAMGSV
jgi:hypothetical protein